MYKYRINCCDVKFSATFNNFFMLKCASNPNSHTLIKIPTIPHTKRFSINAYLLRNLKLIYRVYFCYLSENDSVEEAAAIYSRL